MGGEAYVCNSCAKKHIRYYSCRNRHCALCQNTQKEAWIEAQEQKIIGCTYYHIVFTVPHQLNDLFLMFPRQMYALLMRTAWLTLEGFGWNKKYLGAQLGTTMVLHTWGSNMSYHPHVHCIVPGGGVSINSKWLHAKGNGKFLFPVKAMSPVFRGKFIHHLNQWMVLEGMQLDSHTIKQLNAKPWTVYAKPPFGGTDGVIKYLARYSHKICITNHRIINYDGQSVTFSYTDYRKANQKKIMKLSAHEFIRRYVLHILPKGFSRIRHFGILSSAWKNFMFPHIKPLKTNWQKLWQQKGLNVLQCPHCNSGTIQLIHTIHTLRGPPFLKITSNSKTSC
jgi:hypothetical protein